MNHNTDESRWALNDIVSALDWAKYRSQQGISAALDPLGEYAQSAIQAEESAGSYLMTLDQISASGCAASLAVKLSALGLNFDRQLSEHHLQKIIEHARQRNIPVEIDIEGTPTVPVVCEIAQSFAKSGHSLILALQAYLNRSADDLRLSLDAGLKIRLVKGAYRGDTENFNEIQQRFMLLFSSLLAAKVTFDVGTHDPVLLADMTAKLDEKTGNLVCFGFLKGLADQTKLDMVQKGLRVSEYVPFGCNRRAYVMRRHAYLKRLQELGLAPAP